MESGGAWNTMVAVGVNREHGHTLPAYAIESSRAFASPWTVFGRAEVLDNEHLAEDARQHRVGKLSLGASYRLSAWGPMGLRVGALASTYHVPGALEDEYGSSPFSGMVFLRTQIE